MIRPEWALPGTVAISPAVRLPGFARRRRDPGDIRLIRAPGEEGKARTIPGFSPIPPTSRVPCRETTWGLELHRGAGVQLTLVIRIVKTCRFGAAR
jgi:hypothetical protein